MKRWSASRYDAFALGPAEQDQVLQRDLFLAHQPCGDQHLLDRRHTLLAQQPRLLGARQREQHDHAGDHEHGQDQAESQHGFRADRQVRQPPSDATSHRPTPRRCPGGK
ncbi:MAG: hypothetical protein NVV68_01400 [Dokdonella sp.]|nr:hypothetical protein [Dokdonella sp.]